MIIEDTRIFLILQKNKISRFLKIFTKRDWVRISVFIAFLLVAFILAISTYFFSKTTFLFLKSYPQFMSGMVFYILLTWFFLIFLLTLGSSFISALGTLFVQDDDDFLLSCPIRSQIIFESRFVNLLSLSCWPIIVFGTPLLLAFYQSFNLGFFSFILSFLILILILFISSLMASILALKITSFTGQKGRKLVNILGVISLPFLAWWVAQILIPSKLIQAFQKLQLEQINQFLKSLPISSNFFPSTWGVNFIFYWQENPLLAIFNLEKILLLLIALTVLTYLLVNREYFYDLDRARVDRFIAGPHDITQSVLAKKPFPYFLKGIKGVLTEKDILMFSRNQAEILQGGFILFIVLLYFLILSKFPITKLGQRLPNFSINNIIKMSFLINSYILAILSLRFIFPSISLEGQTSWLIWSAPFSKAKLFWQKLFTGWAFLSLAGGIISFLSTLILKLDLQFLLAQFSVFLALSLGLTSINLGMGTILPNFEEKNPEKISTSSGGIFSTSLSLFYIFAVYFILFSQPDSFSLLHTSQLLIWLMSIMLTFFFSFISLSRIDKYHF